MLTATRLTYRINWFEIRAILLATALSVIVSAIVIAWIRNSGYLACVSGDAQNATCFELQDVGAWATRIASLSINLAAFFRPSPGSSSGRRSSPGSSTAGPPASRGRSVRRGCAVTPKRLLRSSSSLSRRCS